VEAINDIIMKVFIENQRLTEELDYMHRTACAVDPSSRACTEYNQHAALGPGGAVLQIPPEYIGLGPYGSPTEVGGDAGAISRGADDCFLTPEEIAADPIADGFVLAWEMLQFGNASNATVLVSGISLDGDNVAGCNNVNLNTGVPLPAAATVMNLCEAIMETWGGVSTFQSTASSMNSSASVTQNICSQPAQSFQQTGNNMGPIWAHAASQCDYDSSSTGLCITVPGQTVDTLVWIGIPAANAAAMGSAAAWSDCFLTHDEVMTNEAAVIYAAGTYAMRVATHTQDANGTLTGLTYGMPFPTLAGMPHTEGAMTTADYITGCSNGEVPHWHRLNQTMVVSLDPLYITQMMDGLGITDGTIDQADLGCDSSAPGDACADLHLLTNSIQQALCANLGLADCSMVSISSMSGATSIGHAQLNVIMPNVTLPTDDDADNLLDLTELLDQDPTCRAVMDPNGPQAACTNTPGCAYCSDTVGPSYCVAKCNSEATCQTMPNHPNRACVGPKLMFLWALQEAICSNAGSCSNPDSVEIVSVSTATQEVRYIDGAVLAPTMDGLVGGPDSGPGVVSSSTGAINNPGVGGNYSGYIVPGVG
jgi:hypothetical protein